MKTLPVLFLLSILSASLFMGCQKDYPTTTPTHIIDTLVIHDTIRIHDTVAPVPLTKVQMLTAKDWMVDEISRNISGTNSHYVRNGVNTTGVTYSNINFHFNADGTGTYTDETAVTHTMNWIFSSTDQTNMQITIGAPYANVFYWNIVELKNNFFYNTTMQSTNILVSSRFIQVP